MSHEQFCNKGLEEDGGGLTNGDHVKVGEVQFAKETGFLLIGERGRLLN